MMPRSKISARQAEGHRYLQLAAIDLRPPSTAVPKEPKVVTTDDVSRTDACVLALMADAAAYAPSNHKSC